MADKIIRNMDEDVWRQFTGLCKVKNVIVGEELTHLLKGYVKNAKIEISGEKK